MTGEIIRIGLALALVLGMLVAGSRFLRKRQEIRGFMSIVGYCSLGQKKGIAACRVGRDLLLIGVTQNSISLLKSYREDELDSSFIREMKDNVRKLKGMREAIGERR